MNKINVLSLCIAIIGAYSNGMAGATITGTLIKSKTLNCPTDIILDLPNFKYGFEIENSMVVRGSDGWFDRTYMRSCGQVSKDRQVRSCSYWAHNGASFGAEFQGSTIDNQMRYLTLLEHPVMAPEGDGETWGTEINCTYKLNSTIKINHVISCAHIDEPCE